MASAAGFLLYVLSKVTEDLSKAGADAAGGGRLACPLSSARLTGFMALLYQEDG